VYQLVQQGMGRATFGAREVQAPLVRQGAPLEGQRLGHASGLRRERREPRREHVLERLSDVRLELLCRQDPEVVDEAHLTAIEELAHPLEQVERTTRRSFVEPAREATQVGGAAKDGLEQRRRLRRRQWQHLQWTALPSKGVRSQRQGFVRSPPVAVDEHQGVIAGQPRRGGQQPDGRLVRLLQVVDGDEQAMPGRRRHHLVHRRLHLAAPIAGDVRLRSHGRRAELRRDVPMETGQQGAVLPGHRLRFRRDVQQRPEQCDGRAVGLPVHAGVDLHGLHARELGVHHQLVQQPGASGTCRAMQPHDPPCAPGGTLQLPGEAFERAVAADQRRVRQVAARQGLDGGVVLRLQPTQGREPLDDLDHGARPHPGVGAEHPKDQRIGLGRHVTGHLRRGDGRRCQTEARSSSVRAG
jgi:hypothetical protein